MSKQFQRRWKSDSVLYTSRKSDSALSQPCLFRRDYLQPKEKEFKQEVVQSEEIIEDHISAFKKTDSQILEPENIQTVMQKLAFFIPQDFRVRVIFAFFGMTFLLFLMLEYFRDQTQDCLKRFKVLSCQIDGNSQECLQLADCILKKANRTGSVFLQQFMIWIGPVVGLAIKNWGLINQLKNKIV